MLVLKNGGYVFLLSIWFIKLGNREKIYWKCICNVRMCIRYFFEFYSCYKRIKKKIILIVYEFI